MFSHANSTDLANVSNAKKITINPFSVTRQERYFLGQLLKQYGRKVNEFKPEQEYFLSGINNLCFSVSLTLMQIDNAMRYHALQRNTNKDLPFEYLCLGGISLQDDGRMIIAELEQPHGYVNPLAMSDAENRDLYAGLGTCSHHYITDYMSPTQTPVFLQYPLLRRASSRYPHEQRYEVQGEWIGRGAFGEVHKSVAVLAPGQGLLQVKKRSHAIKLQKYRNAEHRSKAMREVELSKMAQHLHVKPLVSNVFVDKPESTAMVLRYFSGSDLFSVLADDRDGIRELTTLQRVDISLVIAFALHQQIHRSGLVFRDLKPENIILHADDTSPLGYRAHMIDLGLAQNASESDKDHSACGTVGYCAPEQYESKKTSYKTDIFSLGKVYSLIFRADIGDIYTEAGEESIAKGYAESINPKFLCLFVGVTDLTNQCRDALSGLIKTMCHRYQKHRPDIADVVRRLLYVRSQLKRFSDAYADAHELALTIGLSLGRLASYGRVTKEAYTDWFTTIDGLLRDLPDDDQVVMEFVAASGIHCLANCKNKSAVTEFVLHLKQKLDAIVSKLNDLEAQANQQNDITAKVHAAYARFGEYTFSLDGLEELGLKLDKDIHRIQQAIFDSSLAGVGVAGSGLFARAQVGASEAPASADESLPVFSCALS